MSPGYRTPLGSDAVLAAAPTPGQASALSLTRLRTALIRGGRCRGIEAAAARLKAVFAAEQLRQLDAACQAADELAEATAAAFGQHPDVEIISSFPGLGEIAGARVL